MWVVPVEFVPTGYEILRLDGPQAAGPSGRGVSLTRRERTVQLSKKPAPRNSGAGRKAKHGVRGRYRLWGRSYFTQSAQTLTLGS